MNITVHASHEPHNPARPYFLTAKSEGFGTPDEVREYVRRNLPAYLKVNYCRDWAITDRVAYGMKIDVNFQPTKGNARNDSGIKRYTTFTKKMRELGHDVTFTQPKQAVSTSYYATEADLHAAIGL